MFAVLPATVLLIGLQTMLAGFPWIRSSAIAAPEPTPPPEAAAVATGPPTRVVVLSAASPAYHALAVPPSARRNPSASTHLMVFRAGICVLDRGLVDDHKEGVTAPDTIEESGVLERAAAAADGREAVLVETHYSSHRVAKPGVGTRADEQIQSTTTLTLLDPDHPDGLWKLTLEGGRWIRAIDVLSESSGIVVTTFVPRDGAADFRILDSSGRERLRVPESRAEALGVSSSCEGGCFVAAEMKFQDDYATLPERGIMVFDVATAKSWTYGWRYGNPEEPSSWSLGRRGVLTVNLPGETRRFDPTGRRL